MSRDDDGPVNLSVVIVSHNSAEVLASCCRAARSQLPTAELIVVDNASTDRTPALAREFAGVTVLANERNVGFGRACNQGAAVASGSKVMFLNPDVEILQVDENALAAEACVRPFGLMAPTLEQGVRGASAGEHWTLGLLRHVLGPLRPRELPEPRRRVLARSTWCPAGALLLVDGEEFRRLGGFDQRFFLYYEDLDLARRYRAAGLPVRRTRSVRGTHPGGGSSTGEHAGAAIRGGWAYLSWIEYLCTWNGRDAAARAARTAHGLRAGVDRALALLEHLGPVSGRAGRKRRELAALESFVRWQCSFADGTAEEDFCPGAREIVGGL